MPPPSTLALVALATIAWGGDRAPIISFGPDPSFGLLVNYTVGKRPFDAPDPAMPTVVFVHGTNIATPFLRPTMTPRLAEAIHRRYGTGINVLGWDWSAESKPRWTPSATLENVIDQGHRLGESLIRAGIDPGRTHVIGQSAGATLAAAAARWMVNHGYAPLLQVTMIEPAKFHHDAIFHRLYAQGAARFVEHYWCDSRSSFGAPANQSGVIDIRLARMRGVLGFINPIYCDHINIVRWYVRSVESADRTRGFGASRLFAR